MDVNIDVDIDIYVDVDVDTNKDINIDEWTSEQSWMTMALLINVWKWWHLKT